MGRYDLILLATAATALFATIFNSYHLPLGFDLYHNLIIALIVSIGLVGYFFTYSKDILIPSSIITWILILALIIIQPFINTISYPDYLIFPIGTLVLTIVFSIAIANIEDKHSFLNRYLIILIGCMLLSLAIQLMQMRGYKLSYSEFVIFPSSGTRFDANFTQPNQAAFMFALSELACLYFYYLKKSKIWMLCCALSIIGIALTTSRGGLIMGIAALIFFNIFYDQSLIKKAKNIFYQLFGFTTIYFFGVFVYKNFRISASQSMSAVERLGKGSDARISFQEQAYYMFQDNPLTGHGWGTFSKGGIEYANELGVIQFTKHSHLFVTQIASELGILGLLCLVPVTIYVIKKLSFKMDSYSAICFTMILIVVLYSCSEFPLWFLRFLIIFAVFATLIEDRFLLIKAAYSKVLTTITIICSILVIFYISSYLTIYDSIKYLATNDVSDKMVEEIYANTPDVFGMSAFKESILFHYIAIDKNAIEEKLTIAERVTATSVTQRNLFRYARLLALNNEYEKSVAIFKVSCAINWKGNCDKVINELKIITEKDPEVYKDISYKIEKWAIDFNSKDSYKL